MAEAVKQWHESTVTFIALCLGVQKSWLPWVRIMELFPLPSRFWGPVFLLFKWKKRGDETIKLQIRENAWEILNNKATDSERQILRLFGTLWFELSEGNGLDLLIIPVLLDNADVTHLVIKPLPDFQRGYLRVDFNIPW